MDKENQEFFQEIENWKIREQEKTLSPQERKMKEFFDRYKTAEQNIGKDSVKTKTQDPLLKSFSNYLFCLGDQNTSLWKHQLASEIYKSIYGKELKDDLMNTVLMEKMSNQSILLKIEVPLQLDFKDSDQLQGLKKDYELYHQMTRIFIEGIKIWIFF